MSNIIVLGAGMVGSVIARDLSEKHDVTIADIEPQTLKLLKKRLPSINTEEVNALDSEALKNLLQPFDIVIWALKS